MCATKQNDPHAGPTNHTQPNASDVLQLFALDLVQRGGFFIVKPFLQEPFDREAHNDCRSDVKVVHDVNERRCQLLRRVLERGVVALPQQIGLVDTDRNVERHRNVVDRGCHANVNVTQGDLVFQQVVRLEWSQERMDKFVVEINLAFLVLAEAAGEGVVKRIQIQLTLKRLGRANRQRAIRTDELFERKRERSGAGETIWPRTAGRDVRHRGQVRHHDGRIVEITRKRVIVRIRPINKVIRRNVEWPNNVVVTDIICPHVTSGQFARVKQIGLRRDVRRQDDLLVHQTQTTPQREIQEQFVDLFVQYVIQHARIGVRQAVHVSSILVDV